MVTAFSVIHGKNGSQRYSKWRLDMKDLIRDEIKEEKTIFSLWRHSDNPDKPQTVFERLKAIKRR